MTKGKEIQLAKLDNYLALNDSNVNIADILRENLSGSQLTPFDLDRVTVPAGGGLTWEVPDIDEGSIAVKTLTGILMHNAPARSYWAIGLDEGGVPQPPDCGSYDLITGVGNPGGDCGTCPLNEWGSDSKGGRGKACAERRFLFMLRPDSYLPLVVQIPSSSIKAINHYFLRLAGRGEAYHSVVTDLALEKAIQGGGGLPYSRVIPSLAQRLITEDVAKVKSIADALKPMFGKVAQKMAETPEDDEFLNDSE